MKIVLLIPQEGEEPIQRILGDDAARAFIDPDFLPDSWIIFQTAAYTRGEKVEHFNRGNNQVRLSFTVIREHASESEALLFLIDEQRVAVGLTGTLEVSELGQSSGASRFVPGAIVSRVTAVARKGVSTWIRYTVEGGKFTINAS